MDRWNHSIHYARRLLERIPNGAQDALDVGCGEGWLVRELRQRVPHVVGIDPDDGCIAVARSFGEPAGVEYVQGDILTYPLKSESFDIVMAVASLHHFDEAAGLKRMVELLSPGGSLFIVGLARSRSPADLVFDLAGVVSTRAHELTKHYWETAAPKIWPPPHSYGELRRLSAIVLPGRRFQRKAMWRYLLTWTKPAA